MAKGFESPSFPLFQRGRHACQSSLPLRLKLKETLNESFDKLRTNGKCLIPFVVSLSNHKANPLIQRFLKVVSSGRAS